MPQTVAIVEDDPDQRANCAEALQRRGYRVVACGGLAEARTRLAETAPDLAILDIMLGDDHDGGFTLCRELLARTPDLPVLFLSSRSDDLDRISGLRLGACDYQVKPVSLAFLVEKVAALLRMRAPAGQPARPRVHGNLALDVERCNAAWRDSPDCQDEVLWAEKAGRRCIWLRFGPNLPPVPYREPDLVDLRSHAREKGWEELERRLFPSRRHNA